MPIFDNLTQAKVPPLGYPSHAQSQNGTARLDGPPVTPMLSRFCV